LNFSERSWSGWKKRRVYWMKAARTPTVSVPSSTRRPPYQSRSAIATAVSTSTTGKKMA
jgi:hypothetical protein